MKIGILTFHWATNYGAVLQCYALQEYLKSLGNEVEIINYKPHLFDDNVFTFLRFRKFLHIGDYLNNCKKEAALNDFRSSRLHQTERIYACKDMAYIANRYDAIVSGSDQVVNPSFLLNGEGKGTVSPTYFLGFLFDGKRIGYALSFGCVKYPQECVEIAKPFMAKFDKISTRETTGVKIVKAMGRNDAVVVPDPTLLLSSTEYEKLANDSQVNNFPEIYCFFIRHIAERKQVLKSLTLKGSMLWNNEDGDYTLEGWLAKIKHANFVITDSFHCIVMCLKLHTPFAVVTELEGNTGMNDRLFTLLGLLDLEYRIVYKGDVSKIKSIVNTDINWDSVDLKLEDYKSIGAEFLKTI